MKRSEDRILTSHAGSLPRALELLDQLLAGCERPEDILGPHGLFAQLKKALAERSLGAELGLVVVASSPPSPAPTS